MLLLTRNRGQSIIIADSIKVTLIEVNSLTQVRIGIDAPKNVPIYREEIYMRIKKKGWWKRYLTKLNIF